MTKSPFISGRKSPFKPTKPTTGKPVGKVEPKLDTDRVLDDNQVRALMACDTSGDLAALRDRAAFLIGLATGARRTELASLPLRPVEYTRHVVFTITAEGTKPRLIPLAMEAWELTVAYRAALAAKGCTSGNLFRRITQLPGSLRIDPDIMPTGLYFALGRRASAVGVKGFHTVTMRRTFMTWCKAHGLPQRTIAPVIGVRSRWGADDLGDAAARCWGAVRPHLGLG